MFGEEYRTRETELMDLQRQWITNLPDAWHKGVGRILEAVQAIDLRPDLPQVRCPVQVISAGQDVIFPPDEGRTLASSVRNGRFELIPGAGHNLIVEKPAPVAELLVGFHKRFPILSGGFA